MIAAEQYTRRFWPIFVSFPVFGVLAIIFAPSRGIQAFGVFCLAWPLSIPARSVLLTSKLAKRFAKPTTVVFENGVVFFSQSDSGMKLPLEQLRKVDQRRGFFILETKLFNFAPIPVSAFGANASRFEQLVTKRNP